VLEVLRGQKTAEKFFRGKLGRFIRHLSSPRTPVGAIRSPRD
jgi:hypothetical protein